MKKLLIVLVAFAISSFAKVDKDGLVMTEGYKTVKTHCTVCHSGKFISKQRGDRATWLEMIRWMQDTQGLWDLGPDEKTILDYLEKNYKPSGEQRRKNLSPAFMPAKPSVVK